MKVLIASLMALGSTSSQATAAERFPVDPGVFGCSPRIVTRDDTLVLSKASPKLRELAVFRPEAITPHVLVVDSPPSGMEPVMSPGRLGASRQLHLKVAEVTGLEWRVGATQEPVFTVHGTYLFVIAETLESEDGAYGCEVEYQPRRTPTPSPPGATPPGDASRTEK